MRDGESYKQLERVRLQKKLAEMQSVPLTLVMAPMGFGKSSAVREYMQNNVKNYIWISLGQEPVQEEWLWNRINQEMEAVNASLAGQLQQLGLPTGENYRVSVDSFLMLIKRELQDADFYLVLDDYQACNGPAFNRIMLRLAYEDIPGVHVVLISRGHIRISYEELLLKGYCTVINQMDFTLSLEETEELFSANGIMLDEEELNRAYQYTDGWIAAVGLIHHNYRENGVVQYTGTVSRLVRESIFQKLPQADQELLYQMSLFPELSVKELQEVSRQPICARKMHALMEQTGLIHFSQKNQKYAMHSLLRTVALDEYSMDTGEIYRRYAKYMENQGDIISALNFYEKSGDVEAILQILDVGDKFDIIDRMLDFMVRMLEREKDGSLIYKHPTALISLTYALIISSDRFTSYKGRQFYEHMRQYYSNDSVDRDMSYELMGELKVIESILKFNDMKAMNLSLCQAIELRRNKPSVVFAREIYSYGAPETLFLYHKQPGTLRESMENEKEYSRNYMRLIHNVNGSLEDLVEAEYYLETGQMELALQKAGIALQKAEYRNQACVIISSYMVLQRCHIFYGNKSAFEDTMQRCRQYMENISRSMIVMDYDQMAGYVYALTVQLEKIPIWLREREFEGCNLMIRDSRCGCIIYGIYLCYKKKWVQLSANSEEMSAPYDGTRHVFAEIYAGIFDSIAKWNLEDREAAGQRLAETVALAKPDGIKLPFAELSSALMPVLESIVKEDAYIGELLHLSRQWQKGGAAFREQTYTKAVFTPREQEIMELLSAGHRNSEIGNIMNVAQVTVEKNLTNIYRKIGAANRTSAIQWYNNVYKTLDGAGAFL